MILAASLSPHPFGGGRPTEEVVGSPASGRADAAMESSLVVKVVAVVLIAELPQCCRPSWAEPTTPNTIPSKRSAATFPPDSALQINAGLTLAGRFSANTAVVVLAFQQNGRLPKGPLGPTARQFSVYDHLSGALVSYGFEGAECLRKMVCQMGEGPLVGGLVEDVVGFVLSPSRHRSVRRDGGTERESRDVELLLESEFLGRRGGNCTRAFPKCPRTPLDMISTFVPV